MTLQDSPQFENGEVVSRPTTQAWLQRHYRRIYILATILIVIDILLLVYFILTTPQPVPPGGIAGCVTTASAAPVQASIQIGGLERSTYADGCFFFPTVAAGAQTLMVRAGEEALQVTVEIQPGEALELGTVSLP